MAVEQLNFQGINRAISDFSNGGACEELINLRPTGTGLVPVKPFTVMMTGVSYDKLYIHKTGAISNYIAVKLDGDTLYFYWVSEEGEELATLSEISVAGYEHFSVDQVHFAYTGNIILFSICDEEDDFYKNLSFLWDGSEYQIQYAEIPEATFKLYTDTSQSDGIVREQVSLGTDMFTHEAQVEAIERTIDSATGKHKPGCFGYFIAALVFKTKDSKVLCTDRWSFYSPIQTIIQAQDPSSQDPSPWIDDNGHYHNIIWRDSGGNFFSTLWGTRVKAQISLSGSWDEKTSLIESVEVYASKPVPYIVPDSAQNEREDLIIRVMANILDYDKAGLDNQLLYLQKTIPVKEIINKSEPYEFELEFGGAIQATGKTLEVDAGPLTRFGNILSYNARFHYFNSVARIDVKMPEFFYKSEDGGTTPTDVFVIYNEGEKDIVVYVGQKRLPSQTNGKAIAVIAGHSKVIKVITQYESDRYYWAEYPMVESQRYNYSMYVSNEPGEVSDSRIPIYEPSQHSGIITKKETAAINVTEQYNPFVFKVEHSYLAPGAVLDVQPQMVAVKDVTYGDYPLNVFTNRGLYALLQGNGTVLYGNFRSISNLISTGNAAPTEMGTFFLAAGGLWLISGDTVVLVSDALSRGPHMFVRDAPGHYEICHDTYDVLPYLSAVSFEEFTKETNLTSEARLVYNRYRDELMVCNKDFKYCYVLSLKYRQWFKMAQTFSQDMIGEIAFSGAAVYGVVESEGRPATYSTVTLSFTIGDNTYTCEHYVGEKERTLRNLAVAMTNDCRASFAGTPLAEITFHAQEISSGFRFYVVIPGIEDPQSVVASLFKIVKRDETISFTGSFSFSVGRNVVSFEDEDELSHEILVHLQTRTFSIGYQYIHIHRIIAMIRTMLASGHLIVNALYGSDDLQNWELIAYASRKNAQISQIRTPSAARSWRYYTVCIGGHVHWDTDFGTVMFDYQPVVRRIG